MRVKITELCKVAETRLLAVSSSAAAITLPLSAQKLFSQATPESLVIYLFFMSGRKHLSYQN